MILHGKNDLEKSAFKLYPALKKIKELLEVQKLTLDGVNDYLSKSRIKNNSLNENIVSDLKDLLNVLKRSK